MKIINETFKWASSLTQRNDTKYIIIHHRAGDGDVQSIHQGHIERGFSGIGYHFYVRKNGEVHKGRPIGTVGAHTLGKNQDSIGVCFEGNFEKEFAMSSAQQKSGKELIDYLKTLYPMAKVHRHSDFQRTACPGKKFPFDKIKEGVKDMTVDEAVEIVQAKSGLEDETIEFLLCYKYGEELIKKIAEAMI
ncbi:MAG: N-acetylmuramoyl-L-alanine amidase [Clostridia bacterium]|nr:N-acetylmuramoyl-L-alanine amidase [Clostridia bacterium]